MPISSWLPPIRCRKNPSSYRRRWLKAGLSEIESWRFTDRFTERLEYEIDPNWRGELPLTILLGRNGSVRSILGSVDFSDLCAWVEEQDVDTREE